MKILVLGASYDQVYMIRTAKTLGHKVWVADRDPGAPGMNEATHPIAVDTSDVDTLERVARTIEIDGVCTMATNFAPRTVAELARRLGLPSVSPEAAFNATDKARLRFLCTQAGLPVVEGGTARTLAEANHWVKSLRGRAILKPSDGSGCRGIFVVTDSGLLPDLFVNCQRESKSGEVVVERYHEEALVFGVETLVHRGQTHIIVISDKTVRRAPRITTAGVTVPSILKPAQLTQLRNTVQSIHEVLGLHMGASHIDFIRDGDILKVIDVGPRLAGGPLIHELAPQISGVDMIRFVIEQALGVAKTPVLRPVETCGLERFLYAPCEGVLEGFQLPALDERMKMQWRKPVGSILRLDGTNVERLGFITAIRPTLAEAKAAVKKVAADIVLQIRAPCGDLHEMSPLLHTDHS